VLILGIYTGGHDANAALFDDYGMLAAVQQERLTRIKTDGGRVPVEAIAECLAIAGVTAQDVDVVMLGRGAYPARYFTHMPMGRVLGSRLQEMAGREKHKSMEREMVRYARTDSEAMFDAPAFLQAIGCRADIPLRFFNHHEAHALPCLFHTDWDGANGGALLYTADGGGDNVQYSHRHFHDGTLDTLYGGDEAFLEKARIDSVGIAYAIATRALGYRSNRHEGKLTGLAAWGEPVLKEQIDRFFRIDDAGQITTDFAAKGDMRRALGDLFEGQKREDVAASIQVFLEETVLDAVGRLVRKTGAHKLGLAGGVVANVRLNQRLAEDLPLDEVFVYPAMSDAGLAAGGVLRHLLDRDGLETWLAHRWRLDNLYFGRRFGDAIDETLGAADGIRKLEGDPADVAARELANGRIVAIYSQAMEYGPRALGARTILGSPADAIINDTLNERLSRTEFMPFAPVVAEQDAADIFEITDVNRYAARFMTITCATRPEWKERIPAVVHVDGTARPQVISREPNPLYFDILQGFKRETGLPVLINTSFNAHEEPIVNTPAECLRALQDRRVDAVVTDRGYYTHEE